MTSYDSSIVYLSTSHNILRPWIVFQIYGRKMNKVYVSNLSEMYREVIHASEEKKKDLIDMYNYFSQKKKIFRTC